MRKIKPTSFYYTSIFILLFFLSCEQDIEFQYEEKNITSTSFDICATQKCPHIDVHYITFEAPHLLKKPVSQWITETVAASLNQNSSASQSLTSVFQVFINNAQTGYPESITLSDSHEFLAEIAIAYTSNDIVSMRYYATIFTGGAHGFEQELLANFNPQTGALIIPEAIVNNDFYTFANTEFIRSFPNEIIDISPVSFADGTLQIGFNKEGMILLYNDPTIFSPSDKDMSISIPWSDAEDLLSF